MCPCRRSRGGFSGSSGKGGLPQYRIVVTRQIAYNRIPRVCLQGFFPGATRHPVEPLEVSAALVYRDGQPLRRDVLHYPSRVSGDKMGGASEVWSEDCEPGGLGFQRHKRNALVGRRHHKEIGPLVLGE